MHAGEPPVAIRRSWEVVSGTDELIAIPVTAADTSSPSRSKSWVSTTACSSGVRAATVESRQWWTRPFVEGRVPAPSSAPAVASAPSSS